MVVNLKESESKPTSVKPSLRRNWFSPEIGASSFAVAFAFYLFLNLIVGPSLTFRITPEDCNEKSDIWWAMHHYMALNEKPEIFF